MAEECGRCFCEGAAAVLDLNGGQIRMVDGEVAEGLRGVCDDAEGSCGNGFVR